MKVIIKFEEWLFKRLLGDHKDITELKLGTIRYIIALKLRIRQLQRLIDDVGGDIRL